MCSHIDAACFMVNVFRTSCREEMPLNDLAIIQEKVSVAIGKLDAVIDWTRLSFDAALFYHSSIFSETEQGTIRVTKDRLNRDFAFITDEIPEPVLYTLQREIGKVIARKQS